MCPASRTIDGDNLATASDPNGRYANLICPDGDCQNRPHAHSDKTFLDERTYHKTIYNKHGFKPGLIYDGTVPNLFYSQNGYYIVMYNGCIIPGKCLYTQGVVLGPAHACVDDGQSICFMRDGHVEDIDGHVSGTCDMHGMAGRAPRRGPTTRRPSRGPGHSPPRITAAAATTPASTFRPRRSRWTTPSST